MPGEVIPAGKIKCFITGKLRKNTAEERIRQDVARSIVEEYGYHKEDIDIEFPIKMGSTTRRADIVVFSQTKAHIQEHIYMIIETKTEDIKPSDRAEGIKQLGSYIAASPNCSVALWVGNERLAFKTMQVEGEKALSQTNTRCSRSCRKLEVCIQTNA
jgi:type I restriction enzyme M protein